MFEYSLTPANNTNPYILKLTVTYDAITIYTKRPFAITDIPFLGTALKSIEKGLDWLFSKDPSITARLREATPIASNAMNKAYLVCHTLAEKKFDSKVIRFNSPQHSRLHQTDETERVIDHFHLQFNQRITSKFLQQFLVELKNCEEMRHLRGNETFLNHDMRKDIIKQYKQYLKKESHEFGNHPCYNNDDIAKPPTTYEHVQCLLQQNMLPCLPSLATTPECQKALLAENMNQLSNVNNNEPSINNSVIAGSLILGTLGIGLFANCFRQTHNQNIEKSQSKPATSNRSRL